MLSEWAGLYEVTPDDQPILGRLSQPEGLFACTGFSGHGFMPGPASGLVIAEEIIDGRAHTPLYSGTAACCLNRSHRRRSMSMI
ncbi:MAG: FAD-binding oxidoreductase [Gemmatimonadetes bacterium]|nr:FAD-binding oxidoreductase [Gemmatimonadota bacterium]